MSQNLAQADPTTRLASLTKAQLDCLRLVGKLKNSKEIGQILGISPHSVDDRIKRALQKLGMSDRFRAAALLIELEGTAPQRLVPQTPGLASSRSVADSDASPTVPAAGDGIREERDQGLAESSATPAPSDAGSPRSFWELMLAEHQLSVAGRLAVIAGVALAGVVVATLLVSLAEGFSRLT